MDWQALRSRTVALTGQVIQKSDSLLKRVGEVVAPVSSEQQMLTLAMRERDWPKTHQLLVSNTFNVHARALRERVGAPPRRAERLPGPVRIESLGCGVNGAAAREAALHCAARAGATALCRLLIERGAARPCARSAHGAMRRRPATSLRQWLLPLQRTAASGVGSDRPASSARSTHAAGRRGHAAGRRGRRAARSRRRPARGARAACRRARRRRRHGARARPRARRRRAAARPGPGKPTAWGGTPTARSARPTRLAAALPARG